MIKVCKNCHGFSPDIMNTFSRQSTNKQSEKFPLTSPSNSHIKKIYLRQQRYILGKRHRCDFSKNGAINTSRSTKKLGNCVISNNFPIFVKGNLTASNYRMQYVARTIPDNIADGASLTTKISQNELEIQSHSLLM